MSINKYDMLLLKRELMNAVDETERGFVRSKLNEIEEFVYEVSQEVRRGREFFEGGEGERAIDLGPFRIYPSGSSDDGSSGSGGIDIGEGYVQVGGFTIWVEGRESFPTRDHEFVAVDVVIDSSGYPTGSLTEFQDFYALHRAQEDMNHVYIPIYKFKWNDGSSDGGSDEDPPSPALVMDLRRMPMTGELETFLADDGSDDGSSDA